MLLSPRLLRCLMLVVLSFPGLASGQIIFSDSDFLAGSYTTSSANTADIRFNVDYSTLDLFAPFGQPNYTVATIPPSPRGGGTTTGAFLSANNDSTIAGSAAFASISPTGVSVGTGTANPNYVMRVDVFHSTGTGVDDGFGNISQRGSTNWSVVGINQSNTTVQIVNLNAPGATGSLPGQGLALAITADAGNGGTGLNGDDYRALYGGAVYRDRDVGQVDGQSYSQPAGANSGLIGRKLNDYWETQGFEFDPVTPELNDNLHRYPGSPNFYAPDPTNPAGFLSDGSGVDRRVYQEAFPTHNDPLHLSGTGVSPPAFLLPNSVLPGGVPYNQWATHELYWVDGQFTYSINDVPVLQITPDMDGLNGDDNIFSQYSSAGTAVLGFWDLFSSIALDPDGGNFVIYDNLEFEVADANDVPDQMAYLVANGFLISTGLAGDFDGDNDVDGNDFLSWQRGNSPNGVPGVSVSAADLAEWQGAYAPLTAAATAVPEPGSLLLLLGMAGCGLCRRR
ncbi:PEP-CTERM sorting domain-containing protein [Bythopirellula polymerisocia]|uniref:Uncharacterized protein n=1 Tax=Bythopirellula polymerisocia TaxID=2528003 RepID=A0A5C6CH18_9BACT|nr:PEP-CTERM sorting domain-containing protein [Bythopirellula polymerisocia]TWU22571.1 hypothetical protein Pla144_40310 [Bythopirellula polymerisocia]